MKIVFTDFDGVLNSAPYTAWMLQHIRASQGIPRSDSAREMLALDEKNVGWLDRLCREANAELVVSSSWREGRTRPALEAMLRGRGFTGVVRGRTPRWVQDISGIKAAESRGHEIQAWLDAAEDYGIDVESFVILDDVADMAHLADRLIVTSTDTGLTENEVGFAKKLLASPRALLTPPSAAQVEQFGTHPA